MRLGRRASFVALLAVAVLTAFACASFDEDDPGKALPDAAPDTAALPDATAVVDADSAASFDAGRRCQLLAPRVTESFDENAGALVAQAKNGQAYVDAGMIHMSVGNKPESEAYFGKEFVIPTARNFTSATVRFTFKDLRPPPDKYFVETGCAIDFRPTPSSRVQVRIELRTNKLTLDDHLLVDGSAGDSGVGPELVSFPSARTDYPITFDITPSEDHTSLTTVAWVRGEEPVSKISPLPGMPRTIEVHCGIDNLTIPNLDPGTGYGLSMDDVFVELCGD